MNKKLWIGAFPLVVSLFLVLNRVTGQAATAAPTTASAATAANDSNLDDLLRQLERAGKMLQGFTAKLKLTEADTSLGQSTVRTGNVWFVKKPDGSARVHVVFDRTIDEERRIAHTDQKIEYLLDGPWLIERNYKIRNEVKREVLKPGQKLDLFKLGEGPFPLPIGQDPQDVHRQFDVRRVAPTKDDPPNAAHLQLIPKPGTDLARKFATIDVWVDPQSHMPIRVDTLDARKQTARSTELGNLAVNPPGGLSDADFRLPNIDKENWNRHVESLNEEPMP